MRETIAGEQPQAARLTLPEDVAARFAELAAHVVDRSQIAWGEHCSECGFPLCYSTCAFYTPRADMHCRRFVAGIEEVTPAPAGTAPFRIRFRKWGKLEGSGPVAVRSPRAAARLQIVDDAAVALLNHSPLPYGVRRSLGARWNQAKGQALRSGHVPNGTSAFVIESWTPNGASYPFTVTFVPPPGQTGGMFQENFSVTSQYQRVVIPSDRIAKHVDLSKPFLIQIEPVGEAAGLDVVFGMCDFATLTFADVATVTAKSSAATATPEKAGKSGEKAAKGEKPVKVVVWDLDETVWHGILGESGFEGVRLRDQVTEVIKALDERGIVQSIASKNDHEEALAALTKLGLAEYFLHPQVNWGPKSDSIRRIAERLDLGIDSFVFIDDQPFERNEVQSAHATLRVLPESALAEMLEHPWFNVPVTAESRGRRAMYQAEVGRVKAFEDSGTDYVAFLRGCNIVLELGDLGPASIERVYELSQRTNQLNFTGARLSREEVGALAKGGPDQWCATMRCRDRFGEYGLIGFAVLDLRAGCVMEFFMSCRVQRKRVESAFFAHINALVAQRGHDTLRARFKRTARNGTAHTMLTELGFTVRESEEGVMYERDVKLPFADSDIVHITQEKAQ